MNCSIKSYRFPRSVYPGEMFNISAAAVGQRHGVAPATIIATIIGSHGVLRLVKQNDTSSRCVTLVYVLHSKHKVETFELTVKKSTLGDNSFYYNYPPPVVTVSLTSLCPWGFALQHDPPYCM